VPGDTIRHAGLGIVVLVPDEAVEPLAALGRDGGEQVVGALDIATGDPAAHFFAVRRVDAVGVRYTDIGELPPKCECSHLVTRVRRAEEDGGGKGAGADDGILVGRSAVPEGATDPEPWAGPLEPAGERGIGEAGLLPFLPALADALISREPLRPQAIQEV